MFFWFFFNKLLKYSVAGRKWKLFVKLKEDENFTFMIHWVSWGLNFEYDFKMYKKDRSLCSCLGETGLNFSSHKWIPVYLAWIERFSSLVHITANCIRLCFWYALFNLTHKMWQNMKFNLYIDWTRRGFFVSLKEK